MTVLITLVIPIGGDSGPFNLFSNIDGYVAPFATNISAAALQAGYTSTVVPEGTITIRVKSIGVCTNYIDIQVNVLPTTTTTSSSSTSTTTSTSSTSTSTSTSTTTSTSTSTSTTTSTTTAPPTPEPVYRVRGGIGIVPCSDGFDAFVPVGSGGFVVGDIIQYVRFLDASIIICGEIMATDTQVPDAYIFSLTPVDVCGNPTYCDIPNPG